MHEASLIEETLRLAELRCREAGARSIESIRLRVGVLSGVVPEALEFAFEALKGSTAASQARLEIERLPVAARCARCDDEFECEDFIVACPRCGQVSVELRQGRELELVSLQVS